MANILAGSHLVHDLGYLESGLSGSLAQLVICDELVSWLRTCLAELEVTDETLALDLIDEVGPDGHFTDSDHTLAHFRERWYPTVMERYDYQGWLARGGEDLGQRAAARADEVLEEHQPELLPTDVRRGLQAVVERATERSRD
jgi:trimethylamine--corrinoid protein Co-methyltransferase